MCFVLDWFCGRVLRCLTLRPFLEWVWGMQESLLVGFCWFYCFSESHLNVLEWGPCFHGFKKCPPVFYTPPEFASISCKSA